MSKEGQSTQVIIPDELSKKLKKFRIARLAKDNGGKVKAIVVKITYHEEGEKSSMEEDDDLDDVDTSGEVDLEELVEALPTSSPRYIVLVFWKQYDDGRETERLALVNWVPPNSNPTQLTLHAMASKQFEKAVMANTVIEVREGAEGLNMELLLEKTK
ncbi:maturation factor [Schizopora paradoxa]|uniref:Maturation factor n=1 Tax=Schizopora paradoxa TaxID=27342 RepID=A0A0H2RPJ2_9AGAM|nr:maturation factor [Schizopora paradoxa]